MFCYIDEHWKKTVWHKLPHFGTNYNFNNLSAFRIWHKLPPFWHKLPPFWHKLAQIKSSNIYSYIVVY